MQAAQDAQPVATGIDGLDTILEGGLTPNRLYLVEGLPGAGKTTMALQFLREGVRRGETVLYVTLSETEAELREVAASHGWSLEGIHIHELIPIGDQFDPDEQNTMFHPSEVELATVTRGILAEVERLQPQRVVFDSLSEIRLLAGTMLRFRRQILALKQYFARRKATVLLLDENHQAEQGLNAHTIVHGVISMDQLRPEFGGDRRRLRVTKMRGRDFHGGFHDYEILTGGVDVFPRLVAANHRRAVDGGTLHSGLDALDSLLGGGIDRGTSTLLIGAAGTGKSSLAMHFVMEAAERGERSAVFLFEESMHAFRTRSTGLGLDLERRIADGSVTIQPVDPSELSPGEFFQIVRNAVEESGARIIVIDSLNGYLNAMPGERFLITQLHELLSYLGQMGVSAFLINAQQGLIGNMTSALDVSYLADTVVLLRYFEARGAVRTAISVLKKRTGAHERTLRELEISGEGISIGEPLRSFRGVLTGAPQDVDGQPAPIPAAPA
ncbi:MAG: ATPase domain-containing protein [Luteimonas sp.]